MKGTEIRKIPLEDHFHQHLSYNAKRTTTYSERIREFLRKTVALDLRGRQSEKLVFHS